ncbi:MAG: N-acetylneuraminate synthase family protein, partial [Pseudobdellovibrionaceae bacterium]
MAQKYLTPHVVSEIGCNHKGDMQIAKELIKLSKDAGAYSAKFQKRTPKELLTPEQYDAPHPNPANAYGKTYGEHREFLEFNIQQHSELKKYCESLGVVYATSVWDVTSGKEVISLQPEFIKVPSACNNHYKLLALLRDEYKGDVHISTG